MVNNKQKMNINYLFNIWPENKICLFEHVMYVNCEVPHETAAFAHDTTANSSRH